MNPTDKPYIIGIDLGTTNSALSYVDLREEGEKAGMIQLFRIPQLTGAGEFNRIPVLPSFLYIPGAYDIPEEAVRVPWQTEEDNFAGQFARDHGSKVPARLVSSAKSWLCHSGVDRNSRILPWGAGEEVSKVSPVQATAAYLKHLKRAWNSTKGDDADQYLENQFVNITVPASFDEVARDLTLEAATLAGLKDVTLLEEPLAAFYSWLIRHEKRWSEYVKPDELILVCDVGGGTTDFTLITLREVEGSPRFERIAVGDHLILGGDNVDLALARQVEAKIRDKGKKVDSLSGDRWKTLCHECRQAKEAILDGKTDSRKITLMGGGRKLIADTISVDLDRELVEKVVLEGFYPLVDAVELQKPAQRKGITEFGLPYEPEPAITRHIGWFLERHKESVRAVLNRESPAPDLVLFNGGSLKSPLIRERIREAIRRWFKMDDSEMPRMLENPDPDLAVALGASYYGLVKVGKGVRVGSGSARSFYIGVAVEDQVGRTGGHAICLVERGLDEGSDIELPDRRFEVLTNQPVSFDLFSSSYRSGDRCGDLILVDDTLRPLPPLQTVVQYGKKEAMSRIPVRIQAQYTEMGTLALWCRSDITPHKWRLQFQLRDAAPPIEVADREVFDEEVLVGVREHVRAVFSDPSQLERLDSVAKEITRMVERSKQNWPLVLIREMADELIDLLPTGQVPPRMESRWLNLIGFCMRPGFGEGFDEQRIRKIWRIHKNGPKNPNNPQVRSEWWIFWRRVAGGLKSGHQRQFIQELQGSMPKKGGKIPPQEQLEIFMAVANMEQLLVKDKIKWGRRLLSDTGKKSKPQHFWSLSRIGARELLYGPADRVIPPGEAREWIEKLMKADLPDPGPVFDAVIRMARKTGDRTRDIDSAFAGELILWLRKNKAPESGIRMIETIVRMEKAEASTVFGESLPSGLVLRLGE